jgi:hydroxymethylglutaryl-CoA lyase
MQDLHPVKIVECPRDAMQGLHHFIPTDVKVSYLNQLLRAGFDILDAGSFVSPKAIPQMRDTAEVFNKLDLAKSKTKILAIVANERGGNDAVQFDMVNYLGFPFSVSETFQQRNTHSGIQESLLTVEKLQSLATATGKEVMVYISMAFGNPYGDDWSPEVSARWIDKIVALGVKNIALADTVGVAQPSDISNMFRQMISAFPHVEFGAHLHCTPYNWLKKTEAAWSAGCRKFDTAIKGYGGCPMAKDELVGNLATESFVEFVDQHKENMNLDRNQLALCIQAADSVFNPVSAS